MTEPEELLRQLDDNIEDIMRKAGYYEIREQYQELKMQQEEYNSLKNEGIETVRQHLYEIFDEDEVIGKRVKVRDGSVYKTNSPSKADKKELSDAIASDQRFTQEELDTAQEAMNMKNNRLKKEIKNKERILMADDRAFDAVTLKIKRGSRYLKLLRLDGGKNHKMQPLEDIELKHVEELHKFIMYAEEKQELLELMTDRISEAIEELDGKLEAVRQIEAQE